MRRTVQISLIVFILMYISTFFYDLSTYLIGYNYLINVEKNIKYYFEENGYIPSNYKNNLERKNIFVYSSKDFYVKGEEISYKIEYKLTIINSYILKDKIIIEGYCNSSIFIA